MLPPMAPAPPVTTATRLTAAPDGPRRSRLELSGLELSGLDLAARAAAFAPASWPNTRASVSPPPCSIRWPQTRLTAPAAYSPGTGWPSGRSTWARSSCCGPPVVPAMPGQVSMAYRRLRSSGTSVSADRPNRSSRPARAAALYSSRVPASTAGSTPMLPGQVGRAGRGLDPAAGHFGRVVRAPGVVVRRAEQPVQRAGQPGCLVEDGPAGQRAAGSGCAAGN